MKQNVELRYHIISNNCLYFIPLCIMFDSMIEVSRFPEESVCSEEALKEKPCENTKILLLFLISVYRLFAHVEI